MNPILRFLRAAAVSALALLALASASGAVPALQRGGEAQLRAYLTSGVVRLGDRAALIVTVENAGSCELRGLPKVDGLVLGPIPEPAQRFSLQYDITGSRQMQSVTRTWSIPIRPLAVGEHAIPPLELLVDGAQRRTQELHLRVVADLRGEELGFFEMRASSPRVIVGQPFSIELLFGFEAAIAERTNYGNLALSWWGNLPGLLENETPPAAGARKLKLSLNDRETIEVESVEPPREINGRRFVTLRLTRSYTPTRTGTIEFPTSFFEFGEVVERRDFFRTERTKGETFFVRAPDLRVEVVPLPEKGRPIDFSGAIGSIKASASATPRDVDAGESIKFKVEWSGQGNLEFFSAPDPARLDAFRDFRVYGRTEDKGFDRRVVVYDLAPITSQARQIPPLPLTVYDPQTERYTTIATPPIEIRVRALEGASGLDADERGEKFEEDLRDIVAEAPPTSPDAPLGAGWVAGLTGAAPIAWLALRTMVRRRYDPDAPRERARRRARRRLRKALGAARDPRRQLVALYEFLGARTDQSPQAWEGRRAREALPASQAERAKELEQCIAELERSVWGGGGSALDRARLERAADEAVAGGL